MTPFTTVYEPGDVVLVWFRFSSGDAAKRRPAVILTGRPYHTDRLDSVMMAVTSSGGLYFGDCDLLDWQSAGLMKPSQAKAVLQTILQASIERKLGSLSVADFDRVRRSVRQVFNAWV